MLQQYHNKSNNPLIQIFQQYDQMGAIIRRKIRFPRTSRYNWYSKAKIDFEQLANNIKEVYSNIWKLYEFIYQNKELKWLNESLTHGHTSLRNHLLVIVSLIVQDFQHGRLKDILHT